MHSEKPIKPGVYTLKETIYRPYGKAEQIVVSRTKGAFLLANLGVPTNQAGLSLGLNLNVTELRDEKGNLAPLPDNWQDLLDKWVVDVSF